MFDRLDQLEARYEELGRQMSDPTLVNDQENFRKVAKAHRDLERWWRSSARIARSETELPRRN
jgi:protein subunit release factor A